MKKSSVLLNKVEEIYNFKDQLATNKVKARKRLVELEKELEELNTKYVTSNSEGDENSYFNKLKEKHVEIASVKQIAGYQTYNVMKSKMDNADLHKLFDEAQSEYLKHQEQINREIQKIKDNLYDAKKKAQVEIDNLELQISNHEYNKANAKYVSLHQEMKQLREEQDK